MSMVESPVLQNGGATVMDRVQALLRCMEMLVQQHQKLLRLTERQRQALIQGDTETIQGLLQELETTVQSVLVTEEQRIEITAAVAVTKGLAVRDLTAEVLSRELDTVSGTRLLKSVRELRDAVIRLEEANVRNQLLTEQSVRYIWRIVAMIAGAVRHEGYGPAHAPRQSVRLFDVQA